MSHLLLEPSRTPGIPPPQPPVPQAEQIDLQNLFEKYVPYLIDVILEGIMDGRQGERLKMIVPQTGLNMVRTSPRRAPGRQAGDQHRRL